MTLFIHHGNPGRKVDQGLSKVAEHHFRPKRSCSCVRRLDGLCLQYCTCTSAPVIYPAMRDDLGNLTGPGAGVNYCDLTKTCPFCKLHRNSKDHLTKSLTSNPIYDGVTAAEECSVAMLRGKDWECRFTNEQSRARNNSPPGRAMQPRMLFQASNNTPASPLCWTAHLALINCQSDAYKLRPIRQLAIGDIVGEQIW